MHVFDLIVAGSSMHVSL